MLASSSPARNLHTFVEILSQPETWLALRRELAADAAFQKAVKAAAFRKEWLFVGCGTSFYLAEAAASAWKMLTGQRARALPASEVLLFPLLAQLKGADLQTVVISRSGKTSEAIRAAEFLMKKLKVPTLGITCAIDSELSKVCDLTIAIPTADEKSMVMTRSFTSMLLTLMELAASQSNIGSFSTAIEAISGSLSAKIESFHSRVEEFVAKHICGDFIYLAQGPFFAIAREAALKITEMSCSYAQPYHTLEFRHGPKSIVEPQTCLTFFLSESGMDDESEVLVEMKELGGTIIAICNHASDAVRASSDLVLEIEADAPELALLAPFIAPAQLLGFHMGVKKGLNPDETKNLRRVVILD